MEGGLRPNLLVQFMWTLMCSYPAYFAVVYFMICRERYISKNNFLSSSLAASDSYEA